MLEGGVDWQLKRRAQLREAIRSARVALQATTLGITVDSPAGEAEILLSAIDPSHRAARPCSTATCSK